MKNLEKFLSLLDGEVDGLLLTSRYSRMYAAHFDIAEGYAIVGKEGARYFTDSRYIESAQNHIEGFEVIDYGRDLFGCLTRAIEELHIHTLGFCRRASPAHFLPRHIRCFPKGRQRSAPP